MTSLARVMSGLSDEVAILSARLGRRVEIERLGVLERSPSMSLRPAGHRLSPNGSCRLFRVGDGGWMALNLARPEDVDLLPAWLETEVSSTDPWPQIETLTAHRSAADLLAQAILLGLPASRVGEAQPFPDDLNMLRFAPSMSRPARPLKVVDLSALWAGPLCGAIFAELGAQVLRIETRRDPTAESAPEFFRRLNAAKTTIALDVTTPDGRVELQHHVLAADVLISSARPRAFAGLGLDPQAVFATRPGLTWVAITGHGWAGNAGYRVGFGDDTAVAGGLVGCDLDGAPSFLGDALSDPVTGLMAAAAGLRAVESGGGVLVDAAMSRCAATAAAALMDQRAA